MFCLNLLNHKKWHTTVFDANNKLFVYLEHLLQALEWAQLLASMHGPGYARKNPVTPYIHTMLCHLPELLQDLGSVKMFTGQGKTVNNITRYLS